MVTIDNDKGVAIVGLALRLPGGTNSSTGFWKALRDGECAIRKLERSELEAAGVPAHLIARPDYVPYAAPLDDFDHFDADFFHLSPKEALVMDPQHRQFMELSWEALELAGHPPENFDGKIGVYAGSGMGSYFYFNVCSNADIVDETGMFLLRHTGNDKDFLSTRVSHSLDLKGPSINIQTACSTSLVAVHYAAQALLNGECDMALAGGSTIELPHNQGYVYKENEILSPDGQCRAFDHRAQGTVFGSGAGVVALRRLDDAIRDGDPIIAVLKGSAINNDGADKAGYLAPSVSGQADAIEMAQKAAGVTADTIDYVECHGTGTYLGDPIEVAALTDAFRRTTDAQDFCRIGSVKSNIGHLDTAAGIASLAKAALSLKNKEIPPTLGFEAPNPSIPFEGSPFRVNDKLTPWPKRAHPRRAGVNSLGVGGTNAHAVLEEAPAEIVSEESDWPFQLLTLSAKTNSALDAATDQLADYLYADESEKLADVAFTLKEGRHGFEKRKVVVAERHAEASALLRENDPRRVFTHSVVAEDPDFVFMFPGGGAQYAGMARDLYDTEPVFRDWMDKGLDILQPKLDYDVRSIWLPEEGDIAKADHRLKTPSVQLPLIMIVEYALAQMWMSWGVKPQALIGHSMGENTAACLAGVMSFEDCIGLVHLRGTLFDTVPDGGMLSVALPEDQLRARLDDDLDIASVNAPGLTVATGPVAALDRLEQSLKLDQVDCHRIAINIAAHSRMLDPILDDFGAYLKSITLNAPSIPFVSNRTGTWITDEEATSPDYWVSHLRGMVRFSEGITQLAENTDRIYIEVGPGRAMASLASQNQRVKRNQVTGTLRDPSDQIADDAYFVAMLGRVWAMGGRFDWSQLWEGARRKRVALPTYPFQRKRYFIEPGTQTDASAEWLMRIEDPSKWGWKPLWKPTYPDCVIDVSRDLGDAEKENWLVFTDEAGLSTALVDRLRTAGHHVTTVQAGDTFARIGEDAYVVVPEFGGESYEQLIADLAARDELPTRFVHMWLMTGKEKARAGSSVFHRQQEQGFWSLFHFSRAWAAIDGGKLHINVVTSDAVQVQGESLRHPEKATVLGPAKVIPREFPDITCSVVDLRSAGIERARSLIVPLLEELFAKPANLIAAVRGTKRFEQTWQPTTLDAPEHLEIKKGSTILMTGGLGGIGLTLAKRLVKDYDARIAFVSRQNLPARNSWGEILRRNSPTDAMSRRIMALREIEAAGGTFMTLAADVSNPDDMRQAIETVREKWGGINGVVHAAGAIDDAPILSKTTQSVDDVMAAKLHGTQVLTELFPDGSIDWMALFSSVSAVTGPAGQVDYVAANEYLNAVANARQGGKTRVVAIGWGVWADVGMAADAVNIRTQVSDPETKPVNEPLIDAATTDKEGNLQYLAKWRTDEQWVLDEHRTKAGAALLPGTGFLELAAQALSADGHDSRFEVRDLTFLSPLRAEDQGETTVRVTMPRNDGRYSMKVESALDGVTFETNALAEVRVLPMIPPSSLDIDEITERCPRFVIDDNGKMLRSPQEDHLNFGPRWQVLESMRFGEREGLAKLSLPTGDGSYHLHPGLMDIATGWAVELIDDYSPEQFWVPISYRSARFFGQLPAQIVSWVRLVSSTNETARFDISLAAPDGVVCVEIEGFTIHRLSGDLQFAATPPARATSTARPLSPAEERLHHNISQGIQPVDGAEVFLRALGTDVPQIVVSSLSLEGLIAEAERNAAPRASSSQKFERPELESEFIEPEGEIERRLAGFWTELLGVEKIGVEDNFFDLGGHSLIAVRLFAMVKSVFSIDFPISVLFEAPTIRKCALLIKDAGVDPDDFEETGATPSVRSAERTYKHLVPMHQGDGGSKTPFFLVAGMFGNVLNLRHLAHLLGNDRPFYGLQARGLLGDDAPHTDLVDAARDYIDEIRRVQPQGPYMIGGFSGGGLTAYEIARQLTAEGEKIVSLVMLDTPLPRSEKPTRADKLKMHRMRLAEEGVSYIRDYVVGRIAWEINRRRAVKYETSTSEFHNKEIEAAFYEAIGKYEVHPWSGPLTLFRPPLDYRWKVGSGWMNSFLELIDHANFWTPHAENMEVIEVPGDHDSMVLEPNVRVLAARLRTVIEEAEPKDTGKRKLKAAE